jgi:hypothetical protein
VEEVASGRDRRLAQMTRQPNRILCPRYTGAGQQRQEGHTETSMMHRILVWYAWDHPRAVSLKEA